MDDLTKYEFNKFFDTSTFINQLHQCLRVLVIIILSQVRVLGSSDWDYWRENRSVDWVSSNNCP